MVLFDYIQEMMVMAVIETSALLCWISFCGYRHDSHRTLFVVLLYSNEVVQCI